MSRLWIPLVVMAGCWGVTFLVGGMVGEEAAKRNYTRNPSFCHDIRYVHWLNRKSRELNPGKKKILIFGDSILHGIIQNEKTNIPARFAESLDDKNLQVISYALDGLSPTSHFPIMERAVQDGDYVLLDLIYKPTWLGAGKDTAFDRVAAQTHWWQEPFLILRGEVWTWLGSAPSYRLQQGYDWIKLAVRQRTFRPPDKRVETDPPESPSNSLKFVEDDLSEQELLPVREVARLLKERHARALVYMTPFNPLDLKKEGHDRSSVYLANRARVKAVFQKMDIPFIDYNERGLPLQWNDFADGFHLLDRGCVIFGKTLAEDWRKCAWK